MSDNGGGFREPLGDVGGLGLCSVGRRQTSTDGRASGARLVDHGRGRVGPDALEALMDCGTRPHVCRGRGGAGGDVQARNCRLLGALGATPKADQLGFDRYPRARSAEGAGLV